MIQRNLLFALFVAALLLASSCSKTGGSKLAKEVLSVPILIENGFEWTKAGEMDSKGRTWHTAGGGCYVPLTMSEAVAEVQKTLTPENGWARTENPSFIKLKKIIQHREHISIYFTLDPRTLDTRVTVKKVNRK